MAEELTEARMKELLSRLNYREMKGLIRDYITSDAETRDQDLVNKLVNEYGVPNGNRVKSILDMFREAGKKAAEAEGFMKGNADITASYMAKELKTARDAGRLTEALRDYAVGGARKIADGCRAASYDIRQVPGYVLNGAYMTAEGVVMVPHMARRLGSWISHGFCEHLRSMKNYIVHEKLGGFVQNHWNKAQHVAMDHTRADIIVTDLYRENTINNVQEQIDSLDERIVAANEEGNKDLVAALTKDKTYFAELKNEIANPKKEAKWYEFGKKRVAKDKDWQKVKAANLAVEVYRKNEEKEKIGKGDRNLADFITNGTLVGAFIAENKGKVRAKREAHEEKIAERKARFNDKYLAGLKNAIGRVKAARAQRRKVYYAKMNNIYANRLNRDMALAEVRSDAKGGKTSVLGELQLMNERRKCINPAEFIFNREKTKNYTLESLGMVVNPNDTPEMDAGVYTLDLSKAGKTGEDVSETDTRIAKKLPVFTGDGVVTADVAEKKEEAEDIGSMVRIAAAANDENKDAIEALKKENEDLKKRIKELEEAERGKTDTPGKDVAKDLAAASKQTKETASPVVIEDLEPKDMVDINEVPTVTPEQRTALDEGVVASDETTITAKNLQEQYEVARHLRDPAWLKNKKIRFIKGPVKTEDESLSKRGQVPNYVEMGNQSGRERVKTDVEATIPTNGSIPQFDDFNYYEDDRIRKLEGDELKALMKEILTPEKQAEFDKILASGDANEIKNYRRRLQEFKYYEQLKNLDKARDARAKGKGNNALGKDNQVKGNFDKLGKDILKTGEDTSDEFTDNALLNK